MSFPFQFMMRGMLESAMRNSSQQREQQEQFPKKLKCPVCNVEHEYQPASEAVVRVQDRCTHDARTIFCAAPCPVCLEETTGPPMVALACGHLICPNDFQGMGGKMGQEAMLSSEQAAERERTEAEENRRNNEDEDDDDEMDGDEAQLFHMIMAMAAMREQGIEPPPELMMPFMRVARTMMGDDGDDDEDYFDEDEDDEDEDDESDYDDMPPLLDADGNVQQEDDDEDSDDDMPPLLDANGNTVQEQARPDDGRCTTSRQDEDDDDSDFADMPPLEDIRGSVGGQQAGGNDSSNTRSGGVGSDANAQQNSGSSKKNDNSSQGRQASSRCKDNGTGTDNGSGDDSDDDSMPPLVNLRGMNAGQQAGGNDSSTNTRSGSGNNRNAQQNSGSSKKNNSSQGRQASNRRSGKGTGANNNGSRDDGDDDSMPDLSIRGGGHHLRAGSDESSDDDSSIPALVGRHSDSEDSSDQDSSFDEMPELEIQQKGSGEDSSKSDSDDFAANDASNDIDTSNVRTRRPRYNVDSSSESDDNSDMPYLLDPEQEPSDDEDSDEATSDEDMPELTVRPDVPSGPNEWDGMPSFNEQMSKENVDNERRNENTSFPHFDRDATFASRVPHAQRLKEATNTAKGMKLRLLKSKLHEMGVSTDHMVEKSELVDAYVKAVVDTTDDEEAAGEASSAPPQPKPATPDRPAPKPELPVDPYADLPSLVPARDPPKDGCWVLSVKDSTWMELQYAFMEDSEIKCRSYGKKFRKGAKLLNATNGSIWVYAPPPAEEDGDGKWEIYQVKEVDLQIKMYDFQKKADAVTDGRDCLWALCPADSTSTESGERNLVCVNIRNPLGKQLRDHIPYSSQLIMNRLGGVWLNVGRGGTSNASMQPGLYHVSSEGSTKRVLDEVDDSSLITFDIDRTGLWVFSPSEEGKAVLTHIDDTGEKKEQSLDVDYKRVEAMVDGCDETVYLHYKVGNRWKLCQASLGKATVKEVSDCARNSDITSDGNGGCWTWKKSGRRGSERTLAHVDSDGNYHEYSRRFRAGSLIASA